MGSPARPPFVDWGLKPGTEYFYVITAVDRRGNESKPSPVVMATTTPPGSKIVTAEANGGTLCFNAAHEDDFIVWALLKQNKVSKKGPAVELDGQSLGNWEIVFSQEDLNGRFVRGGGPVWCQFIQRPLHKNTGPDSGGCRQARVKTLRQ